MNRLISLLLLGVFCHEAAADHATCEWHNCSVPCGSGKRRCDRSDGKRWNLECHKQDCEPFDGCGFADIVFIFDSSASIGEKNWWVTKQFAIDVTQGLDIDGQTKSRIAAVTYSREAVTHFDLNVHTNHDEIEDAIWALTWDAGVTNTFAGLQHAQAVFQRSGREEVKHIVVLITDGVSNVKKYFTIPEAKLMHANGIEIFVVGIAKVDINEIHSICSIPTDFHCHYVTSYNALAAITNTVINDTCKAANLTECDEWSAWSTDCILRNPESGCGAGDHIRTRECRFYLWEGGDADIRNNTEKIPCNKTECPSTLPPPDIECTWTACTVSCGKGTRSCDRGDGLVWTIPCHVQSCDIEDNCGQADVTFLLDSSASIGEKNWWRAKQFAIDVIRGLPVAPDQIHVACVSYSRHGEVEWGLNGAPANNADSLENALWNLPWLRATTYTAQGLELARDLALGGDREGVQRIVIVLTDGESNIQHHRTIPVAQTLHINNTLQVFCISVRETGSPEFDAIASTPTNIYQRSLQHFDGLTDLTGDIVDSTCKAARGVLVP